MNKKNLNIFKKRENLILGLNSALSLGCKIVNIRPEDLSAGVPHLILGLLWQIIRHALLKNISLSKNVDIMGEFGKIQGQVIDNVNFSTFETG